MNHHPFARAAALTVASAGLTAMTALGGIAPANAAQASPTGSGDSATSTTRHEVATVLECYGKINGNRAYVSVLEHNLIPNVIEVMIGGNDHRASRSVKKDFITDGVLRASVKVDGKRALVTGKARRVGEKFDIHDEFTDDEGRHVTIDGFQRRVKNKLTLRHAGSTKPLSCDAAYYVNLTITTEDAPE